VPISFAVVPINRWIGSRIVGDFGGRPGLFCLALPAALLFLYFSAFRCASFSFWRFWNVGVMNFSSQQSAGERPVARQGFAAGITGQDQRPEGCSLVVEKLRFVSFNHSRRNLA